MNIKKLLCILLSLIMCLSILSGCKEEKTSNRNKKSTYKSVIEQAFTAYEEKDVDTLYSLQSNMYYQKYQMRYSNDYGTDELESIFEEKKKSKIEEEIKFNIRNYEKELGANIHFEYEIINDEEYDKTELERFLEDNFDRYNTSSISAMRELKIKLTVIGEDGELSTYIDEFYVLKEDDNWKIFYDYID